MAGDDIEGIEGIGDVVDELLGLPPDRFTEARNAAAKALRAEGRSDAAAAVKGLPRPPLALWALNRLAHEQPAPIESFLAAAEQLRDAYRSGGDIRAATPPVRAAEARVAAAAAELVRAQGKNPTDTVIRALGTALSSAAAVAETAEALRRGRLIHEPEAPSLGDLLGSLPAAPQGAQAKPARQQDARKAERAALDEAIAGAREDASQARDEARAASDAAAEAERQWRSAKKLAELAQQRSDDATEHLQELQQRREEL